MGGQTPKCTKGVYELLRTILLKGDGIHVAEIARILEKSYIVVTNQAKHAEALGLVSSEYKVITIGHLKTHVKQLHLTKKGLEYLEYCAKLCRDWEVLEKLRKRKSEAASQG